MALGMSMSVKVMSSSISVMSPPLRLSVVSVCAYGGVVWDFWCPGFLREFFSCTVMMSGWVLCTRFLSSSILFLMPFMLI